MENQALGLAEAVARLTPAEITVKRVRWRTAFDRLPSSMKIPAMLDRGGDPPFPEAGGPWPDLWIATGRATLPLSVRARRLSGGRTFIVQTQDPRWRTRDYDLVVAPEHDGLSGPNVLPIVGSPHRVSAERLAQEAEAFTERLAGFRGPRVAALIGGRSRSFDLTAGHAAELAARMRDAIGSAGGSLMMTFSRRTPAEAQAVLRAEMGDLPGMIWNGEGPNPYFAFLHFADHVLVTEDSANMAAEAASTGRPVHRLPMIPRKRDAKFERLWEKLESLGAARGFDGDLKPWSYAPLEETERAAAHILARLS